MNTPLVFHFVGYIILCVGGAMLFPLLVALFVDQPAVPALLRSVLTTLLAGGAMIGLTRVRRHEISLHDGLAIVALGWLASGLFGALPYLYAVTFVSPIDAFFESISGFTTTGATVLTEIESQSRAILLWRSMTQWLGGMGIVVLFIAILPAVGLGVVRLFRSEVPGPVTERLAPRLRDTARTLWLVYLGITLVEILLLTLAGMSLFDAVCHAFTTMSTGGFGTRNTSIAAYPSVWIHLIITLFMILAGINFSLYYAIIQGQVQRVWKNTEVRWYFSILLAATLLLTLLNLADRTYTSWGSALQHGVFQAASITTTTGFVSADFGQWGFAAQFILFSLMFLGGCAGSTAGAIKITRVLVLVKHGFLEMVRALRPNIVLPLKVDGQPVPELVIRRVLSFFVLYMGLWIVGSLVITLFDYDLVTAMTASAACLGNIGPGLGHVGAVEHFGHIPALGKLFLSFLMLVGRLEVYTVMTLLLPVFWRRR